MNCLQLQGWRQLLQLKDWFFYRFSFCCCCNFFGNMNTLLLLFPQLTNVKHRSRCPTVMFTEAEFMGQRCVNDWGRGSQLWLWTLPKAPTIRSVCQAPKVGLHETISAFKRKFDPHPGSHPFLESDVGLKLILFYIAEGLTWLCAGRANPGWGSYTVYKIFLTTEKQVVKM